VQDKGVSVTVISSNKLVADTLRRQADDFIEVNQIRHLIERDQQQDDQQAHYQSDDDIGEATVISRSD
jgi:uncharacterized LabA/DUF88 family protein